MRFTQQQADAVNAKNRPKRAQDCAGDAFKGKEEELCQMIISHLKSKRWYFTRNMPGRRSTATVGTTDFVVAAPNGVTYWLEIKKKGNKLSEAQNITKHVLLALNHKWGVVYSFSQFLEIIS